MKLPLSRASRTALAIVLLAALAAPAQAQPERPLRGRVDVQELLGRSTRCLADQGQPGLEGHFSGTGQMSHLGAVQLLSKHCVTPLPGGATYISRAQMTLEAANGDQLYGEYAGLLTRSDAGVFTLEGSYFITGGTGAMAWTVDGDYFTQSHGVFLTLAGRIGY